MKILIQYYPDAVDDLDVASLSPKVHFVVNDIPEAEAALGLLERKYMKEGAVVAADDDF